MTTGQQALDQALALLGYGDAAGPGGGEAQALYARQLAAVNQAYCDLWHAEGRADFEPLGDLNGVLGLSERSAMDILPYGVAMFLAQSEGDGDRQQLYAGLYNQKRCGAAPPPAKRRDALFHGMDDGM